MHLFYLFPPSVFYSSFVLFLPKLWVFLSLVSIIWQFFMGPACLYFLWIELYPWRGLCHLVVSPPACIEMVLFVSAACFAAWSALSFSSIPIWSGIRCMNMVIQLQCEDCIEDILDDRLAWLLRWAFGGFYRCLVIGEDDAFVVLRDVFPYSCHTYVYCLQFSCVYVEQCVPARGLNSGCLILGAVCRPSNVSFNAWSVCMDM